ncbi:MAG: endolytic transglycosylase MltG [Clostridia bacterium]|nr:endolytic transglycosylase MltG [Clostridia bacterium]MBQ8971974.1 endolytic transglycosylase MltG [Clostridia bacterium]
MARRRRANRKKQAYTAENYNIRSLHEDREYGLFWYAWLWKVLRPVLVFLCSALIVIGMVTIGYNRVYNAYLAPANPLSAQTVSFDIASGATISQIGESLEKANLLRSKAVFRYLIQLRGLTSNISYGSYKLSPSMTVNEIITELTSGSQTNERVITIVPGWTCEDIADYLVGIQALDDTTEFLRLCNDADVFAGTSYALTAAQETASESFSERKYALEGYLAPDTYRIFLSATPGSILNTLLNQNNHVIDDVFYADAEYVRDDEGNYHEVERYDSGLTMDQTIILASMIEKEAANETDAARVSAVFHNRLKMGWKLESDPTATYLSRATKYILSEEEISSANGYNTYYVTGLPVGPICNPSEASLRAAMNPDISYIQDGYLYFCAGDPGSGRLVFARTREEHEANVATYRPLWEQYDRAHENG